MEELVAVAVERFDGVATEVDGELGRGHAIGGVVFEKLEDAETVNTFGAGVDEEVGGMEVAAEGGPKVGGAELLAEEGGHGGFDVVMEKGGEGVVVGTHAEMVLLGIVDLSDVFGGSVLRGLVAAQ